MLNFSNNIWSEFKRAEFVYFVNNCGQLELDVYIIITEYVCIYLLLIRTNNLIFFFVCYFSKLGILSLNLISVLE